MKQALHIFRKDVTHLWPRIGIVLLLAAAFAVACVQSADPDSGGYEGSWLLTQLLGVLAPSAYVWLIVTLVHRESLPGHRQFWLTRPYRPGSLLAAKTLFILLFVSASLAAKDCFIVAAQGFPLLAYVPGLLLRQVAWTAWVVLPAMAVGVVTNSLQDVGLAASLVALAYALESILTRGVDWPGIEWVRDDLGMLLLLTLSASIVLWQYFRRDTAKARAALTCAAVLVIVALPLLPWNAAFALQMLARRSRIDLTAARVTPGLTPPPPVRAAAVIPRRPVAIALPLRFTGFPRGMTLVPGAVQVAIVSGQSEVWRSGWQPDGVARKIVDYVSQTVYLDSEVFRTLQRQPVAVRLSLGLTLLEDRPPVHVPVRQRSFSFEGIRCEDRFPDTYPPPIWCLATVKAPPRILVALETPGAAVALGQIEFPSYAPYDALLGQNPLSSIPLPTGPPADSLAAARSLWERPDAQFVLTPQRPVAHFRRDVQFPDLLLANYVQTTP